MDILSDDDNDDEDDDDVDDNDVIDAVLTTQPVGRASRPMSAYRRE